MIEHRKQKTENRKQKAERKKTIFSYFFLTPFCLLLSAFCFLSLFGCSYLAHKPVAISESKSDTKLYRGVYHVHSQYSMDSKAKLSTIIQTAKKADLDFVVITDHDNQTAAAAYEKMKLTSEDPKLFFGSEITTKDGHLAAIGVSSTPSKDLSTSKVIEDIHQQNGYALISHPTSENIPWKNWDVKTYDGMEIYNFSEALERQGGFSNLLRRWFLTTRKFLKSSLKTPYTELTMWDQLLKERKVIGVAAVDAHIRKSWFRLAPQNLLMQFQSVTVYARADELKEKNIFEAIGKGRTFMAFETFGFARDFVFVTRDGAVRQSAGDEVSFKEGMDFQIQVPQEAEIRLIRDGQIVQRTHDRELVHKIQAKGTYRVEVYLKGKLWIFSNPIWIS